MTITLSCVACSSGNARKVLGINKDVPDEFRVISQAPLTVPPDFHLRPPKPGAKRPQYTALDAQAEQTLFSVESSSLPPRTIGEQALLNKTQGKSNPDIRKIIAEDNRLEEVEIKEKGFLEKIVDYTRGENDKDPVVNASKEKERIQQKTQEGETITGEDTPEVEKKKKGGILNRTLGL